MKTIYKCEILGTFKETKDFLHNFTLVMTMKGVKHNINKIRNEICSYNSLKLTSVKRLRVVSSKEVTI